MITISVASEVVHKTLIVSRKPIAAAGGVALECVCVLLGFINAFV